MVEKKKSQKGFVAVTLITVLAIALVLIAYATLLSTFTGGEVVVGSLAAQVWYSTTNTTTDSDWTSTLNVSGISDSWYAKINFTSAYTGEVKITWQLEMKGADWANVTNVNATEVTTIELTGSGQDVYASNNGAVNTNHDWSTAIQTTGDGQYRVKAFITTTS